MSAVDTGGQAFPRPASEAHQHGMYKPQDGMTLRDYFAAKAMQGYMGQPDFSEFAYEQWAFASYAIADAMLKARAA